MKLLCSWPNFVRSTAKQDLAGYELFDSGTESKPNRLDQHFVWRKRGFPESELRIRVDVAGNTISTYQYDLSPTDTWEREYKKIQANELLGTIARFFIIALIATTVSAFCYGLNQHNIRWRFTIVSSSVVALLVVLSQANNWMGVLYASYDTSSTLLKFGALTALKALWQAILAFKASVLVVGGAETIYRRTWPEHMAMPYVFALKGMAQAHFRRKVLFGYMLVGAMMFWTIGYYVLGQKLGFFCPLGVELESAGYLLSGN